MGKNKRNIIVAATLAMLFTSFNPAVADSLSNLLQMDVKKSSAADTVDVTFYTTGEASNSVVTRKANNRYVVLLPNTSSTASVAPSIGGVKDLITDVEVKHVNDGIGGYTKVTFGTTKPINIKTHMKKTNPLTQAQKDSQAIIAKNNAVTKPATEQPKAQATPKEVAKTTTNNTQTKPVTQATTQKTSTPKVIPVSVPKAPVVASTPKKETVKPKVEQKVQPKAVTQPKVEAKVQPKVVTKQPVAQTPSDTYVPRMKFDKNGKRIIDLEPRVSHKIVVEQPTKSVKVEPLVAEEQAPIREVAPVVAESAIETPVSTPSKTSHDMPVWILFAGGGVALLGILYLMYDAMKHANEKDQSRLESFFKLSSQSAAKRRRREYYDIANNKDLNWQEKYKMYVEKEERRKPKKDESAMSYITDMSGLKKAIVEPEVQVEQPVQEVVSAPKAELKPQPIVKSHEDVVKEKLQAKISQMEHSLAQTPTAKEPEEVSNEVKSEDNAITNKISEIKLKSFSKPVSLKETQRSLLEDDKKISRNKSYEEGRFVKLSNSPLSVNRRKSGASKLAISDLLTTGSKYLTNNGEMKMSKENENYLVSSLNEYISLLDSEATSTATVSRNSVADTLSQVKSSSAQAMSRSGVSNPISRGSNPMTKNASPATYMNGLIVKSGYNIDSEKGFYVVNIDGVSALVGRIKDNIFVLKKFDQVVDKPIQVRQDHGSVYIVRVGGFKCLVDVSKDKMGTLIEI
ncbi:hypothetical protein J6A34_05340 [bacterium]|nr:hypothetical protein [bacterium]